MDTIAVDPYYTLIVATLVLLVGRLMVDRIKFLQDFNIPEPVAGGLLAAVIIYILHVSTGVSFAFDKGLQDSFMLIFFSSIGLSADFSRLKAGGVGLVLGGLIGGPVARKLVNKMGMKPSAKAAQAHDTADTAIDDVFEHAHQRRLITANAAVETMALFAACLAFSALMTTPEVKSFLPSWFTLPQFVWALLFGVLLRNFLTSAFKVNMFDRAIDVFGNASLSIFLGIALLNLKLWQLLDLALPMLIILAVQTAIMALYAYFVTYRFMGKDYDAAVLSAGHCGFGLGATPTAVANMQSVTERFGPSHKAFLIVPMVGAFFIDFVNAFILTGFVNFLGK